MARITVEDCLQNVDNLFQLVLLAAQRARRLANGAEATLPLENDKPTVLALREIAAGNITAEMLREPEPPASSAFLHGMWQYALGTAFLGKGQVNEAEQELANRDLEGQVSRSTVVLAKHRPQHHVNRARSSRRQH